MIDTKSLHQAITTYKFDAKPRNSNRSEPCTTGELENAVNKTAALLSMIVKKIEEIEQK